MSKLWATFFVLVAVSVGYGYDGTGFVNQEEMQAEFKKTIQGATRLEVYHCIAPWVRLHFWQRREKRIAVYEDGGKIASFVDSIVFIVKPPRLTVVNGKETMAQEGFVVDGPEYYSLRFYAEKKNVLELPLLTQTSVACAQLRAGSAIEIRRDAVLSAYAEIEGLARKAGRIH